MCVILGFGIKLYLRKVTAPKRPVTVSAFALPFVCVAYAALWFVLYATVNETVFHHDPGIGDGWYTNVGNGYAIDMIDVTDQGIVHPTEGDMNGLNSAGSLSGVRRLQISSPYLFGTQDKDGFKHLGQESEEEDTFFAIDSRDHSKTSLSTEAALRTYASSRGIKLELQPIATVYGKYRFCLFDYCAVAVLLLFPLGAVLLLFRAAYRLKHSG